MKDADADADADVADDDADVADDLNDVDADVHLAKVWFPWIRFAHWLVAAEAAKFDRWWDHFETSIVIGMMLTLVIGEEIRRNMAPPWKGINSPACEKFLSHPVGRGGVCGRDHTTLLAHRSTLHVPHFLYHISISL